MFPGIIIWLLSIITWSSFLRAFCCDALGGCCCCARKSASSGKKEQTKQSNPFASIDYTLDVIRLHGSYFPSSFVPLAPLTYRICVSPPSLLCGLVDEGLVDVGDDATASNGPLDEHIQLLVPADGELEWRFSYRTQNLKSQTWPKITHVTY